MTRYRCTTCATITNTSNRHNPPEVICPTCAAKYAVDTVEIPNAEQPVERSELPRVEIPANNGTEGTVELTAVDLANMTWEQQGYKFRLQFREWERDGQTDAEYEDLCRLLGSRGRYEIHGDGWSEPLGTVAAEGGEFRADGGFCERNADHPVYAAATMLASII